MNKINQFIGYFNDEVSKIEKLTNKLYQKILYTTILDALSRARYPEEEYHSVRFKNFIIDYGNWIHKNKISLIQLQLNLTSMLTKDQAKSSHLLSSTKREIAKWESGHIYDASVDPIFDEMNKMLIYPDEKVIVEKEEQKAVIKAKYLELFYTYRCMLIHEFRKPGYAFDDIGDTEAFYHSYINAPWQLGFPVGMFEKLCHTCLKNLKQYLHDNKIDPYKHYQLGSMWTEHKKPQKH